MKSYIYCNYSSEPSEYEQANKMGPCFSSCVTVVREGKMCDRDGEVLFCQAGNNPGRGFPSTTTNTALCFLSPTWHTLFFLLSLLLLVLAANTVSTPCIIRPFLTEAVRVSLHWISSPAVWTAQPSPECLLLLPASEVCTLVMSPGGEEGAHVGVQRGKRIVSYVLGCLQLFLLLQWMWSSSESTYNVVKSKLPSSRTGRPREKWPDWTDLIVSVCVLSTRSHNAFQASQKKKQKKQKIQPALCQKFSWFWRPETALLIQWAKKWQPQKFSLCRGRVLELSFKTNKQNTEKATKSF